MMAFLFVLATARAEPIAECESTLNHVFYLRQMESASPTGGFREALGLLGLLLPKGTLAVTRAAGSIDLARVDGLSFSQHKANDLWGSLYFRMNYLEGREVVRQIEFKNWKDRGLPSEACARRNGDGGWDVTTSALYDEGVPHHHLLLKYSDEGVLREVVVTTREPDSPARVTRFLPHAPRDAR